MALIPRPAPTPPPGGRPVLVLRALGLGDVLTAVPALRALRRALPGRPLVLAGPPEPGALLRSLGVVDGVVPAAGLDGPPPGLGLGPHLAVDLHGRGPQSHRLLQAAAPGRLVAFGCPEAGVRGPRWDPGEHEVLRWCRLLRSTLGRAATAGPEDLRLALPSAPAAPGPVVVHPGAASGSRRWPAGRFAAVARRLGPDVVVSGSAAEAGLCRDVVRRSGLPPSADRCGRLDLPGLAALLAGARLLVCGDTGVAHLATALGTPSVLLFGPTPPATWGPLVDPELHRVRWHPDPADPDGDPHGDRPGAALLRITVAEVVDAAAELLGTRLPVGAPA